MAGKKKKATKEELTEQLDKIQGPTWTQMTTTLLSYLEKVP